MYTDSSLHIPPHADQIVEAMLHAYDDLILILNKDGVILEHKSGNSFHLHALWKTKLRKKVQDMLPVDAGLKITAGLDSLRQGSGAVQFEFSTLTHAETKWYEVRLITAFDEQAIAFFRDITKHKLSEEKIKSHLNQLDAMRSIDLAITSGRDLKQTLSMILDYIRKYLKVDAASVLLLNPQTQRLDFAAGVGFLTNALQFTHLKIGEGLAGQSVHKRTLIHVSDLKKRETGLLYSANFSGENFVEYYAIPLAVREQILGVLEIFHRSKLSAGEEWNHFLNILAGQASIAIDSAVMLKNLQQSNVELTLAYDKTIDGWSRALDLRDKETEEHTRRVTELTLRLAQKLEIPEAEKKHIRRGAILHDIGKVAIPDHILFKPGALTTEEWTIMRRHPLIAEEILMPISYLASALPIPRFHHEKWDGSGYPDGRAGEAIPLAARLFAFADVYDALTSNRPYRPAWSQADALHYIRKNSGSHFDPKIVPAFIHMMAG